MCSGQPLEVPTVIGNNAAPVPRRLRSAFSSSSMFTLFNIQSVFRESTVIQKRITDARLNAVALVETWRDDAFSLDLIACIINGFTLIKIARPRKDVASLLIDHSVVCLFCEALFLAQDIHSSTNFHSF